MCYKTVRLNGCVKLVVKGSERCVSHTRYSVSVTISAAYGLALVVVVANTGSNMSKTKKPTPKKSIMLGGGIETTQGADTPTRMALLLWGAATAGKTTFAATAPGDKLWLSFGDNEHVSVMHRKDVHVADLSKMSTADLFKQAQSENPFGLDAILMENENIATVVMDSLTALTFKALQKAVHVDKVGESNKFKPSMMAPGKSAYGGRNGIVLEAVTGLLRVTAKHNVHCIITAHEADPTMKQENNQEIIDFIGMQLGGQLVNNMTWRLSEIWYLSQEPDKERRRRVAIRPTRLRKPMKTRMFKSNQAPEFYLNYDAERPDTDKDQMTIARYCNAWLDGGGLKLDVPGVSHTAKKK